MYLFICTVRDAWGNTITSFELQARSYEDALERVELYVCPDQRDDIDLTRISYIG